MLGPEPSIIAGDVSPALDLIVAGLERGATKSARHLASLAAHSLAVDFNDLACAVSDLLYLIENDAPDSERINRTLGELGRRIRVSPSLSELVLKANREAALG